MNDPVIGKTELETPDGPGLVVGLVEGMIEVRYPGSRRLKIWNRVDLERLNKPKDKVQIADPEAVARYDQLKEAGVNPLVPGEVRQHQAEVAGVRVDAEGNPLSSSGKRLGGVAKERALAKIAAAGQS